MKKNSILVLMIIIILGGASVATATESRAFFVAHPNDDNNSFIFKSDNERPSHKKRIREPSKKKHFISNKSIRSRGTSCASIGKSLKIAAQKGALKSIPIKMQNAGAHQYLLIGDTKDVGKVLIKKNQSKLRIQAQSKTQIACNESPCPSAQTVKSTATCSKNICPIVFAQDSTHIKTYCKNPFSTKRLTKKQREVQKAKRLKNIRCIHKSKWCTGLDPKTGKKTVIKKTSLGKGAAFQVIKNEEDKRKKYVQPRKTKAPQYKQRSQPRPPKQQQAKGGESGGGNPLGGILKQVQSALKGKDARKAQERARAAREKAKKDREYQLLLQLPQCHPKHPYYQYNAEKCSGKKNPIIESYGSVTKKKSSASAQKNTTIQRKSAQNVMQGQGSTKAKTVEGLNAAKCKDKKPKAIIVAKKKKGVKGNVEATIRWASVCTASCSVMGYDVKTGEKSLRQPEIGGRGDITGNLYSDTRFDISCKGFNAKDIAKSTITIKL